MRIVILGLSLSLAGCLYSFRGSSIPPHLKTIAVSLFDDQSGSGEPGLREKFTNKLVDKFRQDNSLQVADKLHADSFVEGVIQSLTDLPLVVAAGETVTKHRLTVSVKVTYQDVKLKRKVFEKEFVNWGDFDATGGLDQRQSAINVALDKLTEDILNDTVSGW